MMKKQIGQPLIANWFEYNENCPWSEVDERLHSNFVKAHDVVVEIDKLKLELFNEFGAFSKHVEEVRLALNDKVTLAIAAARNAAELVLPAYRLKQSGPAHAFGLAFNAAVDEISGFGDMLRVLEADLVLKDAVYIRFRDRVYDEDTTLQDAIDNDKRLLYEEDGRHSIDYVGFDAAEQRLGDTYSYHHQRWEATIQYRNDVVNNYNTLLLEVRVQYGIWEEFALRCRLISEITQMFDAKADALRN